MLNWLVPAGFYDSADPNFPAGVFLVDDGSKISEILDSIEEIKVQCSNLHFAIRRPMRSDYVAQIALSLGIDFSRLLVTLNAPNPGKRGNKELQAWSFYLRLKHQNPKLRVKEAYRLAEQEFRKMHPNGKFPSIGSVTRYGAKKLKNWDTKL